MPNSILEYIPVATTLLAAIIFLWFLHWMLLGRHENLGAQKRLPRQLLLFLLTVLSLLLVIVLFPMTDSARGQAVALLGIVITGVIALSSTTFVANIMAGLMLHVVKSFNPGDYIRVGDQMGRVTERGLFHTEIQTEDRDLTTLPNLHLATNPLTVVRGSGTIISAELSLGYDIPHKLVEELLKQAAIQTRLQEPFVLILSLDDFSVLYRVSGFLSEVKSLITSKSLLKKNILDALHEHQVEIVSPSFMNQRQLQPEHKIIPRQDKKQPATSADKETRAEEIIFDKAEVAAQAEGLRAEIEKLELQLSELKKSRKGADKEDYEAIDFQVQIAEQKKQQLSAELEKLIQSGEAE